MGAPKGSKNALGNKGGGRKSKYQEIADAQFLWDVFTQDHDIEKLKKQLESKKHSLFLKMILMALDGNERFLSDIFKKLFPDSMVLSGNLNQKTIHGIEGDIKEILMMAAAESKKQNKAKRNDMQAVDRAAEVAKEAISKQKSTTKPKRRKKIIVV